MHLKIMLMVAILWIAGVATASGAWASHECFGQSGDHGGAGNNNFSGTSDADVWSGLAGDDAADGKGGGDRLCGDDDLDGTNAAPGDFLGGGGADKLDGGGSRDIFKGEDGNDDLYGRNGNDVLYGGGGADFLDGGNDNDDIWCGGGSPDTAVAAFGDTYHNATECENFV